MSNTSMRPLVFSSGQPTASERKRYAHYSVRLGEDLDRRAHVVSQGSGVARMTHELFRVPSHQEFVVRMYAETTSAERDRALAEAHEMRDGDWALFPADVWSRHWSADRGYWFFVTKRGNTCDDPCQQLELEMMIDWELAKGEALERT